jgi:hypothetical protein
MRHAWCVPMLVCAVLATPSAIAQEFDRDAYVEERLNAVRAYFDSPNGANERLAMAQQLMSIGSTEPLEADGMWGPDTETRLRGIIDTMSRIGIPMDEATPFETTRAVMRWRAQVLLADIGIGDWPD